MIAAINESVTQRNIGRICHFTPSRNLVHIVTDPRGLLATRCLTEDEKAVFNQTDMDRLDGYPDHICCSIQYPNAWYFRRARNRDRLFRDWVVLLLHPHYLWKQGTKFCPRNAASKGGRDVREGADAFEAMFASRIVGAYNKVYTRGAKADSLPTDEQAEVLIPDQVVREDVIGVAVMDESQAKREIARLQTLKERVPRILVAPDFFNANWLSTTLRSGNSPTEEEFYAGDDNV